MEIKSLYSVSNGPLLQQILQDVCNNYNPFIPFLIDYYHQLTTAVPVSSLTDESIFEINYLHHLWTSDTNTRMTRYDSVYIIIQRESSNKLLREPVQEAGHWREKFAYNYIPPFSAGAGVSKSPAPATGAGPGSAVVPTREVDGGMMRLFQSACSTVLTPVQQDELIAAMKAHRSPGAAPGTVESCCDFLVRVGLRPEVVPFLIEYNHPLAIACLGQVLHDTSPPVGASAKDLELISKHVVAISQLPRINVKMIPGASTPTPTSTPTQSFLPPHQLQYISSILGQYPPAVFHQLPHRSYMHVLLSLETSLHSIEVMNRLASSITLPYLFLHMYIINNIQSCNNIKDKSIQVCTEHLYVYIYIIYVPV